MNIKISAAEYECRILARFHLKDIKAQGHPDAQILHSSEGWPVVTFTQNRKRYFYDRGRDVFTENIKEASYAVDPKKTVEIPATPADTLKMLRDRRIAERRGVDNLKVFTPPSNSTLKKYGITADDYMKMLEEQDYRCAICGRSPKNRRLNIDHCHKRGHVRGLLCFSCNYGLGFFFDKIASFEKAVEYLKRFRRPDTSTIRD